MELPLPNLEEVRRIAQRLLCPHTTQATPWEQSVDEAWWELVPVLALRWSQDDIDSRLIFKHDEWKKRSVYETLDELLRGKISPGDIAKLEVVRFHGELYSLSNRRLTALLWYQMVRRSEIVSVKCVIRDGNHPRWSRSFSTRSRGLNMQPNPHYSPAQAEHCGGPLFNPQVAALQRIEKLARKHPQQCKGLAALSKVRLRQRGEHEDGLESETLTIATSEPRAMQPSPDACGAAGVFCGEECKPQQSFRIFPHNDFSVFHKDLIDVSGDVPMNDIKEIRGGMQIRIPKMGNINVYEGTKRVVTQGAQVDVLRALVEAVTVPPDLAKVRAYPK